jgi:metal-sulfur cluster biosynthetic enzyme
VNNPAPRTQKSKAINAEELSQAILEKLSSIIDPETGVDVIRMRLIEDLNVDENGQVSYTFRPSSPLCPIAVPLANTIQLAIAKVPGVTSQEVKVTGFVLSDELMELLKRNLEGW